MANGKTEAESKAQISFILGIIGIFVAQLILGIIALVFANQARRIAQAAGQPEPPQARTGRILGIVDICISVVAVLFVIAMFSLAAFLSHR